MAPWLSASQNAHPSKLQTCSLVPANLFGPGGEVLSYPLTRTASPQSGTVRLVSSSEVFPNIK